MLTLMLATALFAQDPAPVKTEPKPEAPATAAATKPTETPKPVVRKAAAPKREEVLAKREAQAEQSAKQAREEKRKATLEKARQARLKKAEQAELKKAKELEARAKASQAQAEAHKKRAEEIKKKANDSWNAYQAASKTPSKPAPAPKALEAPETGQETKK